MELVHILRTLWRRKLLVVLGILVALAAGLASAYNVRLGLPPKLGSKSIEYGSATTQVLIDADTSPLIDLGADLDPLASRAEVYARLVESAPVRAAIERKAGVGPDQLVITGRGSEGLSRAQKEPSAEERANDLRGEAIADRILFEAESGLPMINVFAQAATDERALELANAGAKGLMGYIEQLERESRSPEQSVRVSQLGEPSGGMVNSGASMSVAVLAFVAVLTLWCGLLVIVTGLIDGFRVMRQIDGKWEPEVVPEPVAAEQVFDFPEDAMEPAVRERAG